MKDSCSSTCPVSGQSVLQSCSSSAYIRFQLRYSSYPVCSIQLTYDELSGVYKEGFWPVYVICSYFNMYIYSLYIFIEMLVRINERIGMRAGPFTRGYWAPDDGSRETQIQGLHEGSKKPNCLLVGCLISYMHVHFQRNVASIPYVARFT